MFFFLVIFKFKCVLTSPPLIIKLWWGKRIHSEYSVSVRTCGYAEGRFLNRQTIEISIKIYSLKMVFMTQNSFITLILTTSWITTHDLIVTLGFITLVPGSDDIFNREHHTLETQEYCEPILTRIQYHVKCLNVISLLLWHRWILSNCR